jgi:hypothetical protein
MGNWDVPVCYEYGRRSHTRQYCRFARVSGGEISGSVSLEPNKKVVTRSYGSLTSKRSLEHNIKVPVKGNPTWCGI